MLKSRSGDLKEDKSFGGFIAKLVVALIAVIIVAIIVSDVLGLNIADPCVEEDTLLDEVTGNHCGDDFVFLTDAVNFLPVPNSVESKNNSSFDLNLTGALN